MRLLKYEFYKIVCHRLTMILLLGFLVLNLPLFLWQTTSKYQYIIDSLEEYNRLEMQYRAMPLQEAQEKLEERAKLVKNITLLEMAWQDNHTEMLDYLLADNPKLLETYSQMQEEKTLPSAEEKTAVRLLSEQAVYLSEYQEYIEGMQVQADKMNSVSIFNQPGTFSFRNIAKTPVDFEKNKNLPLSFGLSTGLVAFSCFFPTDVFVLFLLLLLSVRLFWDEKEKGLLVLVKSARNGRLHTVFAKTTVLLLTGTAVALLFHGMNITAAGLLFGFGDISRYIQSMREFGGSNLIITVRQYLCLFLLGKVLLAWVFVLLFSVAFSFFKNNAVAVLAIFGLISGSYLAYRYIPALSVFNPLKFLNPVAALHLMNVLSEYHNINLFGYPCNRVITLFLVMEALLFLSGAAVVFLYMAGLKPTRQRKLVSKFFAFIQAVLSKFHGIHLLWHEFCKLAFFRKMVLLPVLLAFLIFNSFMEKEPVYSFDETVYLDYAAELEGELNGEKEEYIRKEQERFQNLPVEWSLLAEQLAEGEITKNRYDYECFLLEAFENRQRGFQRVLEQYDYIKSLQKAGIRAGFVSELSSDYVFHEPGKDIAAGLLLLLLTVLTTAAAFCQEYKQRMIHIMNPTKNGKGRLYAVKAVITAAFSFSFMAVYTPRYVNSVHFYPLGDTSLPLKNIRQFADFPFEISIKGFLAFSHIIQLAVVLAAMFFTVFLSVKLKNQVTVSITALACLTIPLILYLCGIEFAQYLPFANAFMVNHAVGQKAGWMISGISVILTLGLGVMFAGLSYWKFCNRRRVKDAS